MKEGRSARSIREANMHSRLIVSFLANFWGISIFDSTFLSQTHNSVWSRKTKENIFTRNRAALCHYATIATISTIDSHYSHYKGSLLSIQFYYEMPTRVQSPQVGGHFSGPKLTLMFYFTEQQKKPLISHVGGYFCTFHQGSVVGVRTCQYIPRP